LWNALDSGTPFRGITTGLGICSWSGGKAEAAMKLKRKRNYGFYLENVQAMDANGKRE
jgi:hypothetical protein